MEQTKQVLEYSSVTLALDKTAAQLEFQNSAQGKAIVLLEPAFENFIRAMEKVAPLMDEKATVCKDIQEGLEQGQSNEIKLQDEIFFVEILDTEDLKSQLRLEGSMYKNKVYLFLKRMYFDKKTRAWRYCKGCVGLCWKRDLDLIRSLIQNVRLKQ